MPGERQVRERDARVSEAVGTARETPLNPASSAWNSSIASIAPEARAVAIEMPLPELVVKLWLLGRITMVTGIPMRSSPVMLARRVIPAVAKCGRIVSNVSSGSTLRCVPSQ